jgi:hypothetical protein
MPPFEKGNQFSTGRPRGARNKSTLWLEAMGDKGTQKVIRTVRKRAEDGDMHAAALVLARTWPRRKGQPVQIELPPVTDTAGLVAAQAAVIAAMARGEISPDEAQSIAGLLETQRRTIETNDHARQIEELRIELRKVGNT